MKKLNAGIATKLLLLCLLTLFIGSCRSDKSVSTSKDGRPVTTITFAAPELNRQAYELAIAAFNANESAINVQFVSLDQVLRKQETLTTEQLASVADVVLFNRPPPDSAAYFLDLVPLLVADSTFDSDDFWPGLLDSCQVDTHLVGIPVTVDVDLVLFDRGAFAVTNLPLPAPGWTWNDFREATQALTQQDGYQTVRYGFVDGGQPIRLLAPLADEVIAKNSTSLPEALLPTLNWYVDLVDEGAIPVYAANNGEKAFFEGEALVDKRQVAMWLGNLGDRRRKQVSLGEDVIGVAPFPIDTDSTNTNPAVPTCAAISAGTTYPEEAWAWLRFLSNQAVSGPLQSTPARPTVANSSGYWDNLDEETETSLRFALEHAWYGSYTTPTMRTIDNVLQQAIYNRESLAEVLSAVNEIPSTPALPKPDGTPVAVATPATTPTSFALSSDFDTRQEILIVDYFVDGTLHNQSAVANLAQVFNEAQDKIQIKLFTDPPAFETTYTIIEMAQAYDCFAWGGGPISSKATTYFYQLDPLLDAEESALVNDFFPSLLEGNRSDGKLYGLPMSSQPYVLYYDADYLADLGLEPPKPDWTLDDFWSLAQAATYNEEDDRIYGFIPYILWPGDFLLFTQPAATLYDLSVTPPIANFTEPATAQSLTWLAVMVDEGVMYPSYHGNSYATQADIQRRLQQQYTLIRNGQAAMWIDLAKSGDIDPGIGVTSLPTAYIPPPTSSALYISKRTSDPAGCWEWLKFLTAQPHSVRGGIPARYSVFNSPQWATAAGLDVAVAYQSTLSKPIRPVPKLDDPNLQVPFPLFRWWQDALESAFMGIDPDVALAEVQKKADAYLTCIMAYEDRNLEQVVTCAQAVDPQFKAPWE